MSQYLANLTKNRLVVLLTGTVGGQAIIALAAPLVTRLYTPSEFGIFSAFTATLSLVVVISSLRYDVAIPLPKNDDDALILLLAAGIFSIVSGLVCALFVAVFARRFGFPLDLTSVVLLPLAIIFLSWYQALSGWAIRMGQARAISSTKIYQSVVAVLIQVVGGAIYPRAVTLVFGQMLSQSVGISRLLMLVDRENLRRLTLSQAKLLLKRYKQFPITSMPAALCNMAAIQMPIPLIALSYGSGEAGYFALAQKLVGLPIDLLSQSMSQAYLMSIREVRGLEHEQQIHLQYTRRLFFLTIPVALYCLAIVEVANTIFGDQWKNATPLMLIMIPYFMAKVVGSPLTQALIYRERLKRLLIIDLSRAIAVWICFTYVNNDLQKSVAAYSFTMTFFYTIYFFAALRAIRRGSDDSKI